MIHSTYVRREGTGWIMECTCGMTTPPVVYKRWAEASAKGHLDVQKAVGGAVAPIMGR